MVALKRINKFLILPREAPKFVDPRPPLTWPSEGRVEVDNLVVRYAVGEAVSQDGLHTEDHHLTA